MKEVCENHTKTLKEYGRCFQETNSTRRISFFNRDIPDNLYSLGYVETVSQQEGGSFFSDDDNNKNEEKYETLEMQLKQVPRRNISLIRRSKYPISMSSPAKHTPSKHRFKSIIEPRTMFQAYKIIGSEGEENSEFKHPLGTICDTKLIASLIILRSY